MVELRERPQGPSFQRAAVADMSAPPLVEVYRSHGYELGPEIGRGRQGVVYRGLHVSTGIPVALKRLRVLSQERVRELKREFRVLMEGNHPGVALAYELVAEPTEPFFSMELVDGPLLLEWVGARQEPALEESLVVARTVDALSQLAGAVSWLHRRGRIHRDIKPTNVRVRDGRAVLLDFDLSTVVNRGASRRRDVAGTRPYMPNEALWGGQTTTAADVYSLGVLGYECIAGEPAFSASDDIRLHRQKTNGLPDFPEFAPAWLVDLLRRMTDVRPDARPSAHEVASELSGQLRASPISQVVPVGAHVPKVDWLLERYRTRSRERPTILFLSGDASAGKTTVAKSFLERVESAERGRVLEGRCLATATVGFQGLDGVVDSLADWLATVPVDSTLWRHQTPELLELFPTLASAADAPPTEASVGIVDRPAVRRLRGLESLKQLLRELSSGGDLLVFVDDLHWADEPSLAFWADLLATRVPITFVACSRDASSLRSLQSVEGQVAHSLHLTAGDSGDSWELSLPCRDSESWRLLEAASVAVSELDLATLSGCLDIAEPGAAAADLVRRGLIAQPRLDPRMRIVPRTESIRRTVAASVAPSRSASLRRAIASQLETRTDEGSAVACFWHLCAVHETHAALKYARAAGAQLTSRLAFEDAAAVYEAALEHATSDGRLELTQELARALESSGKGGAAGEAYIDASNLATTLGKREVSEVCLRRAAECLLRAGQIRAGNQALDRLLVGLPEPPTSSWRLLVALVLERWLGWLARLFPRLNRGGVLRERLDDLWIATVGTVWSDLPRSMFYQVLHSGAAAGSGDLRHVARALATDGCYLAVVAPKLLGGLAERLGTSSLRVAKATGDSELVAMALCTSTATSFLRGDWGETVVRANEIIDWVDSRCPAADWERVTAYIYCSWSLGFRGDLTDLEALRAKVLAHARAHDDRLALTCVSVGLPNLTWLSRGRPDLARASTTTTMSRWENPTYSAFDFFALFGELLSDLYVGDPGAARERFEVGIIGFHNSPLKHHPVLGPLAHYLSIKTAFPPSPSEPSVARARERRAERSIARLRVRRSPWCRAFESASQAILASARQDRTNTLRHLMRAESLFLSSEMDLYAQAAKHHIGSLTGDRGNAFSQPVVDPDALAQCLIPLCAIS